MEKSVLISLGDSRMKRVAEVLGNASCVRILELLGEEDLAVSDISEKLGMKMNTADYNVKKLVGAGLIESSSHWWSVKGKKMPVYRVSDKRIVISPRKSVATKFLWVLGLTGAIAVWIRSLDFGAEVVRDESLLMAAPRAEALSVGAEVANEVGVWGGLVGWEWFLIGAWLSVVLFIIYSMIAERGVDKNG